MVPVWEPLETRMLLSAFALENGKYTYFDSLGSAVTVTLKGGGSGIVEFPGEETSGTPVITLTPANAKCTLTITVKGANKNIKSTIIDELNVMERGLKSIKAPAVNISGMLWMDIGGGTKITLGDLRGGTVALMGQSTAVTTLTLSYVYPDSYIYAAGLPLSLTAKEIFGESEARPNVVASWYPKIAVKGRMQADVYADGTDAKGVSIGTLTVGHEMWGYITAVGRVNKITVGAANAGCLTAASVGTITTKGYRDFEARHAGYWYYSITVTGTDAKGISIGSMKLAGPILGDSKFEGGLIEFDVKGRINSLTADAIYDRTKGGYVSIAAGSIGMLTVKGKLGDAGTPTYITMTDTDAKGVSIGTLKATGVVTAYINAKGRINTVNMLAMDGGSITAGTIGTISSQIRFGTATTPIGLTLTGKDAKGVSLGNLKAPGTVYSHMSAAGKLNTLTMGSMDGGSIHAGSIGTLTVKGILTGRTVKKGNLSVTMLTLSGAPSGKTLGSARISGALKGDVTIHGDVGSISADTLVNAEVIITGQAGHVGVGQTNMDRKPGPRGFVQVFGGGAVSAKNGTFRISGGETVYIA